MSDETKKHINERKAEQLGMPFGTACNKLRKLILFDLLQRFNLNICCRCNQTIDSVKNITIDHLEPWLDRDPKRFWDLNNIGFAHSKCNVPHKRPDKIISPVGQSWCSACQQHKPVDEFRKGKRWNGYNWECIKCSNDRNVKRYQKLKSGKLANMEL